MLGLRRRPFDARLRVVIILTCCIAVALGSLSVIVYDVFSVRQRMTAELWTLAEIIGSNSAAALLFDDPESATEVLTALSANPDVMFATIFDRRGERFATYARPDVALDAIPGKPEVEGARFAARRLILFRRIEIDDEMLGTVCIQSDLREMYQRLRRNTTVVGVAMLLSVVVAFVLTTRLQRLITAPIHRLARAAEQVSRERDYSVRVPKEAEDDIGVLTAAFNDMLAQIQTRDTALQQAHDALKRRVKERTAELKVQVSERIQTEEALRRSEEQLRQSQKMEAIGRLAGGIAHDFNNLLTAMNGYAELTLHRLEPRHPLRANVEEIRKAAMRAGNLTRQLLAFSRKQVLAPRVLDPGSVIAGMERMLRRLIHENIVLDTSWDEQLGRIQADPSQIEQVLLNLVVNARDAMPHGGRIEIRCFDFHLGEDEESFHPDMAPGRYVAIEVRDTGCGMDDETRSRVFEPFFTTKEPGAGTGLGLSTAYGIIRQSGGFMLVESQPGAGSTFRIFLPRVGAVDDESAAADPARRASRPLGAETVLLVEDEVAVRQLVREILTSHGYSVVEASDGAHALEVAAAHPGRIDLMITDVVMPHLSGPDLVERIAPRRPEMKVVFMSGYTEDAITERIGRARGTAFIGKPFTPAEFALLVRRVLDDPDPDALRGATAG